MSSIRIERARRIRTPLSPLNLHGGAPAVVSCAPSMSSPRRMTSSVAAAFTITPSMFELSMPPRTFEASIVIAFVIVTLPKPPPSRALISPPAAVLLIAPANVLQGAVREHGLTSSPTPETQVRVACADAVGASAPAATRKVAATASRAGSRISAEPRSGT